MAVLHVNTENYESTINGTDKPVFIDFWAEWCAPCKMYSPIFEKAAEKFEGSAVFAKVNVDESESLALANSIVSIPTTLVFKDGKEITRRVGAMTLGEFSQLIG